jgi:competence protein ComEC
MGISFVRIALLVTIIHFLGPWPSLIDLLAEKTALMHDFCINQMPTNSSFKIMNSALICGSSIYNFENINILKSLGLIHLFVVSGFHIQIIHTLLKHFVKKTSWKTSIIINVVLFFYCCICKLNPPVVRSWISIVIGQHTRLTASIICLYSGLATLTLSPNLWGSLSLQLSWTAGLIISIKEMKPAHQGILIYIFVCILLTPNDLAHPLSIFVSLAFTPILSFFLLPISFLGIFFKPLVNLSDFLWNSFLIIGKVLNQELPMFNMMFSLSNDSKWLIIISLNILLYYLEIHSFRQKLCSN